MKVSANRIRAIQLKDFEAAFRTVVGRVAALVLVLSFRESGVLKQLEEWNQCECVIPVRNRLYGSKGDDSENPHRFVVKGIKHGAS